MNVREEFLKERLSGVGGSDVASVLNVGYGCALRLFREKRSERPDFPRDENAAMELGQVLEPWIAKKYEEKTGLLALVAPTARDKEYPELLVHIDRILHGMPSLLVSRSTRHGVLEIKAVGSRVFYEMKRTGLAIDYALQLQWGMMLWDLSLGAFAVCNRDTGELVTWDVKRDDELCQILKERAIAFWADMKGGIAPDRLDPDDPRCHRCEYRRSCQGNALIHIDAKAKMEADESMRPLLKEYEERKQLYEEVSESLEIQKEMIRVAMGDRVAVQAGDHKVYYKPQSAEGWDSKEMASDIGRLSGTVDYDGTFIPALPASIQARYKKLGKPFRPLRIY